MEHGEEAMTNDRALHTAAPATGKTGASAIDGQPTTRHTKTWCAVAERRPESFEAVDRGAKLARYEGETTSKPAEQF
jgi:hypothetical protein